MQFNMPLLEERKRKLIAYLHADGNRKTVVV